jgi:dephospho-CoA kinase
MMLIVGLTGGIGSGKTTVGKLFAELGVPVYNSDREARRLMEESGKVREAIKALLGEQAYRENSPDKAYIAGKVFGNTDLLDRLNAIVHPAVRADFKNWAGQQQNPYLIQEAAILFENGSYHEFDKIVLVHAPREERIRRIGERDGSSREEIEARMAHQWEDDRKIALADYVIENLDLENTRFEVEKIHRHLMKISG